MLSKQYSILKKDLKTQQESLIFKGFETEEDAIATVLRYVNIHLLIKMNMI